ncbi:MAG: hypothetical protein KDK70_31695 [Myxococcales bacterium]|nr:hypothetical protein [Myxococcales bacterium]
MFARVLLLGVLAIGSACRQPNPDWLGPINAVSAVESTSGSSSGDSGEGDSSSSGDSGETGSDDTSSSTGPSQLECAPPPQPGQGACPESCTSCDGGRCRIECRGTGCGDAMGACPPQWPCDMVCVGPNACRDAVLECPVGGDCSVECSGANACRGSTVTCLDGSCSVDCAADPNTCRDLVVQCGSSDSQVVCEDTVLGLVLAPLDGSSCACEHQGCA